MLNVDWHVKMFNWGRNVFCGYKNKYTLCVIHVELHVRVWFQDPLPIDLYNKDVPAM